MKYDSSITPTFRTPFWHNVAYVLVVCNVGEMSHIVVSAVSVRPGFNIPPYLTV